MKENIKRNENPIESPFEKVAAGSFESRLESIEVSLSEVSSIIKEYGSIKNLFRKMDSLERRLGQGKKVMTMKEVSEFTGFSMAQLYVLTRTRAIPHCKPNGKTIFFDKSELNDWLLRNKIETVIEFIDDKYYYRNESK